MSRITSTCSIDGYRNRWNALKKGEQSPPKENPNIADADIEFLEDTFASVLAKMFKTEFEKVLNHESV